MIISLIGFSGTGKSYWSKKLESELGFARYCCDDLIEQRLIQSEASIDGSGIQAVARWMGMPYSEHFQEREALYLKHETAVMNEIIEELSHTPPTRPVIVDTTGSIIYTGEDICTKLQEISKTIYIQVDNSGVDRLLRQYLAHPKPVVWNSMYQPALDESNNAALSRCYHNLLLARARAYEHYADVIIPFSKLKNPQLTVRDFLEFASTT